MSDVVTVAVISAIAALATTGMQVGAWQQNRRLRREITNDHTENIRDDMDGKHNASTALLTTLRRDVGGIRQDIRDLRHDVQSLDARTHDLETTQQKGPHHAQ